MDRQQASQVTMGLVLIVIGLLFLAGELEIGWAGGWFGSVEVGRLWPVILITLGVGRFLAPRRDGRWGGGAWLIFLGVLFLMHTQRVVSLLDSWPLFIVAGGVSVILGGRAAPHRPAPGIGGDR